MTIKLSGPPVLWTTAVDWQFQNRALEQAKLGKSEPGKISPKVGAVLVHNAKIIAEAHRGEMRQGEHAEYTLLERKLGDVDVTGTTLYTTLEPCTTRHDPKRPCAHRIIERGIAKVVIGLLDPHDLIRGDGWWTLREAGVGVDFFFEDLAKQVEDLNHEFTQMHRGPSRRTVAETREPLPKGQIGGNGGRIGYLDNGDKVEWIRDDETGDELPLLLRRNDRSIMAEYYELWEKVWYNRQRVREQRIAAGDIQLTDMDKRMLLSKLNLMREVERKYGKENLRWDDFDWGLLSGRFSALAWVMGADWDESLDT